jgi:hypothetical protein
VERIAELSEEVRGVSKDSPYQDVSMFERGYDVKRAALAPLRSLRGVGFPHFPDMGRDF